MEETANKTTPTVIGEESPERDESEPLPVTCWVAINRPQGTSDGTAIPDNRSDPAPLDVTQTDHASSSEIPMHEDPVLKRGGNCQFCTKHVTRGTSLKRHYTLHVNTPLPDPKDRETLANILKGKRYHYNICLICGYFYNRFGELMCHVHRHEANGDIPATWRNPNGSDDRYGPVLGRALTTKDCQSILDGVKREGLRYLRVGGKKSLKRKREEEQPGAVGCDEALDASGSQSSRVETDNIGGLSRPISCNLLQDDSAGNSDSQHGGSGGKEDNLQETDGLTVNGSSSPTPHDPSQPITNEASHLQDGKGVGSVPKDGASPRGLSPLASGGKEQESSV